MRALLGCVLLVWVSVLCEAAIDDFLRDAVPDKSVFAMDMDGTVRAEYDILYTKEQWEELHAIKHADPETRAKRKAIREERFRWTNNEIPYEMGGFTYEVQQRITDAMRIWEKYTCIKFRPRRSSDKNYVYITNSGGCFSYIGMANTGMQYLNLGPDCHIPSLILHELGHAIGFEHEHCRSDRDQYVSILLGNVSPALHYAFERKNTDNRGVPYDYRSIMHYGQRSFSINGQNTIITKDPAYQSEIGMSYMISFRDAQLANLIYSCGAKCPSCSHHGDAYADKNCDCYCPGTPAKICGTTGGDDGLEGCYDTDSECENYAAMGQCETHPDYARVACAKSCGCGDISKAVCRDVEGQCDYYKKNGDCERNPDYMKMSCRQTCGFCGGGGGDGGDGGTDGSCSDSHSSCSEWASEGECDKNPDWMHENCVKSCDLCGGGGGGDGGDGSTGGSCSDSHLSCQKWAREGECDMNPDWMHENCVKSCGRCESGSCVDSNGSCKDWADRGECFANPGWMHENCAKSCGKC